MLPISRLVSLSLILTDDPPLAEIAALRRGDARTNQRLPAYQHTIQILRTQLQASMQATEGLRTQLAQAQMQARHYRQEVAGLRTQTAQLRGCAGEYQQHIQFLERQIGFYHGQLRARDQRLAQLVIAAPAHVQPPQEVQDYSGAGAAEPRAEGTRSRQQQQQQQQLFMATAPVYASQQPAGVQGYRGAGVPEPRIEGRV